MAIPSIGEIQPALLKVLAKHGEMHRLDTIEPICDYFSLTPEEREEKVASGVKRIRHRIMWSSVNLKNAGLLERPQGRRGFMKITELGRSALPNLPEKMNQKDFMQYEPYRTWAKARKKRREDSSKMSESFDASESIDNNVSPEEALSSAQRQIHDVLAGDLLEQILQKRPDFFEKLTIELVEAMGYGGTEGVRKHTGGPGDGGIDGIIEQDALGLDKIHIQAKRYQPDNKISGDTIRAFSGSLGGKQVNKGLFITTSSFTDGAKKAADDAPQNIVLIDGEELARLMIRYNVGCRTDKIYEVKSLDESFFED